MKMIASFNAMCPKRASPTKYEMKFQYCFAFCLLALQLVNSEKLRRCSSPLYIDVNRIYGGQDAQPIEFPHMASLQVRYLDNHICGATLIADNWVLTAAHCFSRSRYPFNWKIKLGEHSLRIKEKTEREFTVTKLFIHENYNNQNQVNDIALLKLNKSVDFNYSDRHIKPVCLADKNFVIKTGHQCVVSGWGKGNKGYVVTDVLQKLYQPLLDWRKCSKAWQGVGWPITEKHICVGDLVSQKGVCSGDSGGPVQCRMANGEWMQVGVTSWTTSVCTASGYAAVFTNVSSYLDWIRNKVQNN